jgi:hypothetical protein
MPAPVCVSDVPCGCASGLWDVMCRVNTLLKEGGVGDTFRPAELATFLKEGGDREPRLCATNYSEAQPSVLLNTNYN